MIFVPSKFIYLQNQKEDRLYVLVENTLKNRQKKVRKRSISHDRRIMFAATKILSQQLT